MVVATNGQLLSNAEVEAIKFLKYIFITERNLEDRRFAIMLLRLKRVEDLPSAMDMTQNIKQTFNWVE